MTKFRAFLSYSHADEVFAARFHKDLEAWRVDRGLVGRETHLGPAPRDLRPIFRDRDDFPGGRKLSDATEEALRQSDFMILLCSPAAAKSIYVNEEIRLFKAMGGSDRIIPVIVDGEPGDPERECFPRALTHALGPDGEIGDEVEDRLAADARDQGDGPRRALAKVVAGLLGIPFDEIVRRAETAQRRRMAALAATAGAMALLAIAAAGFGWLAETRRATAERNYQAALGAADELLQGVGAELIDVQGVDLEQTRAIIGRATEIYEGLQRDLPEAEELRARIIFAHSFFGTAYLDKGYYADALASFDEARNRIGDYLAEEADAGDMAAVQATVHLARATALEQLGEPEAARAALARAEAIAPAPGAEGAFHLETQAPGSAALMRARMDLAAGDMVAADRAAVDAFARIGAALAALEDQTGEAAEAARAHLGGQRMAALIQRGDIAAARGDDRAALGFYVEGRAAAEALRPLRADTAMMDGAIAMAALRAAGAMERLEAAGADAGAEDVAALRQEAEALVAAAAGIERDNLILSLSTAGFAFDAAEQALAEGRSAESAASAIAAIAEIEAGFRQFGDNAEMGAILDELRARNVRLLLDAGAAQEAAPFAETLAAARAARGAPGPHADALALRAEVAAATDDREASLAFLRSEIALRVGQGAEADAYALATARNEAALTLWRLGRRAEALEEMQGRVAAMAPLVEAAPENADLAGELAWSLLNVGELAALTGRGEDALEAFRAGREIAADRLEAAPDDPWAVIDLAWMELRLAQIGDGRDARWPEVARLLRMAEDLSPLGDFEEEALISASIAMVAAAAGGDPGAGDAPASGPSAEPSPAPPVEEPAQRPRRPLRQP